MLTWKGEKSGRGDSFLSQSIWWMRETRDGRCLAEQMMAEATRIAKKGLLTWRQVWDVEHNHWYTAEVLRQKYRLGLYSLPALEQLLSQVQDSWPTNVVQAEHHLEREWQRRDVTMLHDTRTRNVYRMLDQNEGWWSKLSKRWKRDGSQRYWTSRCRHVWNGTPFPKYNIWNWRVLTGALPVGEKLCTWPRTSGLCPWCKSVYESVLHLFWSCPGL